jgi:2',3'-cyclic-nucleotide 2'-phosphodiesterase (5'-nucleotidase family)
MHFILLFLLFVISSCGSFYQTKKVNYHSLKVAQQTVTDSTVYNILQPYANNINGKMNIVIAKLAAPLEKKSPNGSMGLFFTDAMLEQAKEMYKINVDAAFINNGGLRINTLASGNVTIGKVYEVMPFDNLLIVQKVSGTVLQEFLNAIAKRGGWPVAGISFTIQNEKAVDITINNKPFDVSATYHIANSDYIANGGDDCVMLKNIPQISNGYLLRNAFIEYFKKKQIVQPYTAERIKKN